MIWKIYRETVFLSVAFNLCLHRTQVRWLDLSQGSESDFHHRLECVFVKNHWISTVSFFPRFFSLSLVPRLGRGSPAGPGRHSRSGAMRTTGHRGSNVG